MSISEFLRKKQSLIPTYLYIPICYSILRERERRGIVKSRDIIIYFININLIDWEK